MSMLLEKALEKVVALPQDEQDAIASQILASLADEDAWKTRFAVSEAFTLRPRATTSPTAINTPITVSFIIE